MSKFLKYFCFAVVFATLAEKHGQAQDLVHQEHKQEEKSDYKTGGFKNL